MQQEPDMQQLSQTGDSIADDSTGTLIKVTNMGGHFHLFVHNGVDRVAELSGNYPTAQAACRRASHLRTALHAGSTMLQLIDAHIANQAGVLAAADAVLTEALRTEVAPAVKQANRGQSTAAPTTDQMDRVLTTAANTDGRIVRGGQPGQATSTQLIALRKRGLVELVYGKRRNQRVITEGRLTVKGYKHAGVETTERAA
jgi:hypothetical protein